MADYSISAEITADSSKFNKGVNKAEKSLKSFSKGLADNINKLGKNGLVGAMANVSLAVGGLTKSFGTVIKFAKDVGKAINECTEAYKTQVIAERALDTAIQNNPFMSGSSSQALKQFASDMQRVSNYGDEQLIPMMTNLVSLGRTESETMKIMSVAMDMSAGMGISLDTAITQLNATLNGNIGRLGQQNAELKDLTEEELRQGKAVEILGEKFKGLSSATADTSKQLQNIKGDFKEALGQFTLPSSDMWNKFWAGFYERGIEVINKLNSFIDSQTIGRKLASSITEQIARINPSDVGGRVDYTRSVLKVIGDKELEALKTYLSSLRNLNSEQELLLKRIKAEEDSRYQNAINAKKEVEDKKKQAEAEKEITIEVEKQAEAKKTDWGGKLLDQQIEMLEAEKENVIHNAEETGEETYSIYQYYNDRLLELRLERLQNEKEEALKEENLTEEDKIKIDEYYANEEKKIYNSLNDYKDKKRKQEVKQEENKLADILTLTKQYAQKTADTFSKVFKKVVSTIGKVFSGIGNIFKKLFSFNVDDALNNLLAFEDSILTFFIETLPQLPKFFASAVESIIHLIQTIFTSIDFEQVADILASIIKSIGTLITNIAQTINQNADKIISGFTLLVKTVIQGIANWINSGGWRELLKAILVIQKTIETAIADNMEELAKTISAMLPDLIQFLIDSIVSASKTLGKIAKTLLPLIAKLINAIIEVITSDEVIEASIEAIEGIVEGLIPAVIDLLVKAIPKIINFFLFKLPRYTPKLVIGIVKGLIKGFSSVNWGDVVYEIFYGFVEAVKDMFGIHSPSTLFEGFGFNMVEGLVNGLKGIAEAVMIILQPVINVIQSLFNGLFNFISDVIGKILNAVTSINQISFDALNTSIGTLLNSLTKITELSFGAVFDLANISFETLKTTLNSVSDVLNTISTTAVNLVNVSFKGLKDVIESIGNSVANMTNSVAGLVRELKELVKAVNEGMGALNPFSGGSSSSSGSSGESTGKRIIKGILTGGLSELFHWATGTNNAPSGLAVVGEAGPELVRFNGGEQVLNTRNTQKALEGIGGTSNTFNVNFTNVKDTSAYALVSQLKQYNRQLSINGVL